jgi:hypothetical protein
MKHKILRSLGLSAALLGSMGLGASPASAQAFAVFEGTAHINCFGCGVSTGTARLCAIVKFPPPYVCVGIEDTFANYTVNEPAGITCVVSGSASGTTTGAVNVSFNWTRVGAVAVITTTGDINGAGVAAFAVTSPVGVPCGGPVDAIVAGAVAGV